MGAIGERSNGEVHWFDFAQQSQAKAKEDHRRIEEFITWARKGLPDVVRNRARIGSVDLGSFEVEGKKVQVLFGQTSYGARLETGEQTRVTRVNKGIAVSLVVESHDRRVREALVYRKDVEGLPRPVVGHLLNHLDGVRTGRVQPQGSLVSA